MMISNATQPTFGGGASGWGSMLDRIRASMGYSMPTGPGGGNPNEMALRRRNGQRGLEMSGRGDSRFSAAPPMSAPAPVMASGGGLIGQTMAPAGTTLSPQIMEMLKRRGAMQLGGAPTAYAIPDAVRSFNPTFMGMSPTR